MGAGPEGTVQWTRVPDPSADPVATRLQVESSTAFAGGEGIWFHDRVVYFSTKGDNRIWAYETDTAVLSIIYDAATSSTPILTGVDNLTVSPAGDILVAEGGDDGGERWAVDIEHHEEHHCEQQIEHQGQ